MGARADANTMITAALATLTWGDQIARENAMRATRELVFALLEFGLYAAVCALAGVTVLYAVSRIGR